MPPGPEEIPSNPAQSLEHRVGGPECFLPETPLYCAFHVSKLDMWYLHAPDRTTPYDVTLKAVDELYKEG